MNFDTWTYALFIVQTVGGTSIDMAQFTPEGSPCLVPDVSDDKTICKFPADPRQLRFGSNSLRGECQYFSECIDGGNLSLKHEACSDGKYANFKTSDLIVPCATLELIHL